MQKQMVSIFVRKNVLIANYFCFSVQISPSMNEIHGQSNAYYGTFDRFFAHDPVRDAVGDAVGDAVWPMWPGQKERPG